MKTNLLDIIVYLYRNYPKLNELSKPRLVKLIYLIDWKHSIDYNKQVTDIKWYFNHYGPYVEDVINLIKKRRDLFDVNSYENPYGGISDRIKLNDIEYSISLKEIDIQTINFIINNTDKYNWNDFISLVYSTYPIKNNPKYTFLELPKEAEKYKLSKSKL